MYETKIIVKEIDEKLINTLYRSLLPEIMNPPSTKRSIAEIYRESDVITIIIRSKDLSSHRAALNTYLYLLNAVLSSINFLKSFHIDLDK